MFIPELAKLICHVLKLYFKKTISADQSSKEHTLKLTNKFYLCDMFIFIKKA